MTDRSRDELLARVELGALADDLLGVARGTGGTRRWPCPSPGHGPQTGRTPPVTVFWASSGIWRWRCHACGAGGTAIDLLMEARGFSVREAFRDLHRRARTPSTTRASGWSSSPPSPRSARATAWARHALTRYVRACEQRLWAPVGAPARVWLTDRGLHPGVLHANHVGYDPGPGQLSRPRGFPTRGPAIIWPIHDQHGPQYLQARYLDPDTAGRRYDNPASWIATNPRYATLHPAANMTKPDAARCVFVCEGIPDALSITQTGAPAVALLGAGLADRRAAAWLHDHHPDTRLVLAFDADTRGQAASRELGAWLEDLEQDTCDLTLRDGISDVNHWARTDPAGLARAIHDAQQLPMAAVAVEPPPLDL